VETTVGDMERRLVDTERQLRFLRVIVMVGVSAELLMGVGPQMLAATQPARAQQAGSVFKAPFKVVDNRGRALLVVDTGGLGNWHAVVGTRLQLFDGNGKPTAALVASDDGGGVSLDDKAGHRSVGMFAGSGGGALKIVHPTMIGQPAAVLSAYSGGCTFSLYNREGTSSATLQATDETGRLNLIRKGKSVFSAPEPTLEDGRNTAPR
jgi:hypothetical protein